MQEAKGGVFQWQQPAVHAQHHGFEFGRYTVLTACERQSHMSV